MVIGFLGLGEIGTSYSTGLAEAGVSVKGYDVLMDNPANADRFAPCAKSGVQLVGSAKELVEGSDVIMAVTTSHAAVQTAEGVKPYLKPGQVYFELNSATPAVKEEIRDMLPGIDVVDGATMESPSGRHKTLVFISGEKARDVAARLNAVGMNMRFVSEKFGAASGIKIIRSAYTKSMEAALMESMHAACALGIEDELFDTLVELLHTNAKKTFNVSFKTMIRTNAIHSKRRGEEVAGSAEMLKEIGVDNTMSEAASKKLLWLASLGIREHFDGYIPEDAKEALSELTKRAKA